MLAPQRLRTAALAAAIAALAALVWALPAHANVFQSRDLATGLVTAQGAPPAGFSDSPVFSGLANPTAVRFASDGRVFVAEKGGQLKVFDSVTDSTPTVWADLSSKVHDFWDRGLLGLALDPDFPERPYVYVLYTYDKAPGSSQVPRWGDECPTPPGATADGCVVTGRLSRLSAGGVEDVLIEDFCQQYPSHSIGSLAFGPDGALYVSAGDGASFDWPDYGQEGNPRNPCGDPPAGVGGVQSTPTAEGGALRSQDIRTAGDPTGLNGAILRVDPDTGAALPDNPNAGSSDANARRIVAYGFRNPFRIAIRPGTNEVWAADVGWSSFEEIDRIADPTAAARNYGWPCYEGGSRQPGYDALNLNLCESLYSQGAGAVTAPYDAYAHGSPVVPGESCPAGGSSVSGLAFYTHGSFGPDYEDALFFSDFSRSCIWVMFKGANGLPDPTTRQVFATTNGGPAELQIGPGGDLYYVDLYGGTIRRIRGPYNEAPTAAATATPDSGPVPLAVSFDAGGSSDPAGDPLSYAWDLDGDGQFDDSTIADPTRTYTTPGVVGARVRVSDPSGASDVASVTITAGTPPSATIAAPAAGTTWRAGDTIAFSGSAVDSQGTPLAASALSWQLRLEHCDRASTKCHTHVVQEFPSGAGGSFVAPEHEYPSHLELDLTATDGDGLTRKVTRRLDPRTVPLTLQSNPPGARLSLGGETATAPFTFEVIQGSQTAITADTPFAVGGVDYDFAAWSDGGARSHTIVPGTSAATYTATYRPPATLGGPPQVPPPDDTDGGPKPAPSGPVGAWGFEEKRGRAAVDSSGHGNAGAVSGARRVSGRYGRGLAFDGVDDCVRVADDPSLDLTEAMTIEAWVRPSSLGSSWRTVAVKERSRQLAYGLYAGSGRKRGPSAHVFTDRDRGLRGRSALPTRRWSHVAMTWDGRRMRVYVDGRQVASGPLTGAAKGSSGALRIGGNAVWREWFRGLIDDVRIYDRALAPAEIAADRDTPVAGAARTSRKRAERAARRVELPKARKAKQPKPARRSHGTRWVAPTAAR